MTPKELNRIVADNINLVRKIAHQVRKCCNEPFEDLEQQGCIGLLKAIERFDQNKGVKFSCFAVPYIRGEMWRYLRDKSSSISIPRTLHDLHSRIAAVERTGVRSDAEIAQILDVTLAKVREARTAARSRLAVPLPPTELGAVSSSMEGDWVPTAALKKLELDMQKLAGAFEQLEPEVKECLKLTFEKQLGTTLVASALQCSVVKVRKLLALGLKELICDR